MNRRLLLTALLVFGFAASFAQEQPIQRDNSSKYLIRHPDIRKFYVGGTLDAAIFSTAAIHQDNVMYSGGTTQNVNTVGIIRFTGFFNAGFTFNFNFSRTIGLYTGIDCKNIGYIEQDNGYTTKRRTYNIGAPLGIKIGDMSRKGSYLMLGGGLDAPINFKQKTFANDDRGNVTKFSEWYSNRVPGLMPYVFIGGTFYPGVSVKLQYYPNNFLATGYTDNTGAQPYAGTDVNLILLTVGFGMHMYYDHHHMHHMHHRRHNSWDNNPMW